MGICSTNETWHVTVSRRRPLLFGILPDADTARPRSNCVVIFNVFPGASSTDSDSESLPFLSKAGAMPQWVSLSPLLVPVTRKGGSCWGLKPGVLGWERSSHVHPRSSACHWDTIFDVAWAEMVGVCILSWVHQNRASCCVSFGGSQWTDKTGHTEGKTS